MDSLGGCVCNSGGHIVTYYKKYYILYYILYIVHRHLCSNIVYEITLISYIYPRTMTEMNVSTTMGMSATVGETYATVGEMSATVGEMSATVGDYNMSYKTWEMSATVGKLNMV